MHAASRETPTRRSRLPVSCTTSLTRTPPGPRPRFLPCLALRVVSSLPCRAMPWPRAEQRSSSSARIPPLERAKFPLQTRMPATAQPSSPSSRLLAGNHGRSEAQPCLAHPHPHPRVVAPPHAPWHISAPPPVIRFSCSRCSARRHRRQVAVRPWIQDRVLPSSINALHLPNHNTLTSPTG